MPNEEKWNSRWLQGDTPWSYEESNEPFYEDFSKVLSELKIQDKENPSALIPLSGSTSAIKYLKDKEFNVTAVEFSQAAIDNLKKNLFPNLNFKVSGNKHSTENLDIYKSDFFKFNLDTNKKFDLIYDLSLIHI